jgi:peptidoglycan/LPS O-acetylase OafA/YrhL
MNIAIASATQNRKFYGQLTINPMNASTTKQIRGSAVSDHLDFLRALAAVAVLYTHGFPQFLGDSEALFRTSRFAQLVRMPSRLGHSAVIIFFVLSGLFVGGNVVRDVARRSWSWKHYLTNRLVRLYLVLISGLLLTAAWDQAGLRAVGGRTSSAETAKVMVTPQEIADRSGAATFVGNLAFVQTVVVPTYGSNTALWSLSNEFWYYIVFPCLWLALFGVRQWWRRGLYLLLGAGMLVFVGRDISLYFLVWLLGVAACKLPQLPLRYRWMAISMGLLGTAVVCVCLLLVGLARAGSLPIDFIIGGGAALALYAMLHNHAPSREGLYSALAKCLAGFSFSLYVLHLPFLVFLRSCLTYDHGWPPDVRHWLYSMGLMAAVMLYAFFVSLITEANTDRTRNWIISHFRNRPPRHPVPGLLAQKSE